MSAAGALPSWDGSGTDARNTSRPRVDQRKQGAGTAGTAGTASRRAAALGGSLDLARWALAYAARGLHVLPLHDVTTGTCSCHTSCGRNAGKHPRTLDGLDDSTTDAATVVGWWERWPTANIGMACAKSGLVVVDVDGAVGADRLRDLQRIHGVLGAPLWQRSGRLKEGWHLVYRMPDGQRVSVGKLGPHLDVKYRGYIVVAPSLHSSGLRYRWATSDPPGYPPSWLCRLLDPPPSQPRLKRPSFTSPAKPGAARRVLELRAADIAAVPEHGGDTRYLGRHDALRRGATYLGGLVAKGSLDEGEVIDALLAACRDNGYLDEVGERLVYRTIIDGLTHAGVNR